jgi:hypothetical protein
LNPARKQAYSWKAKPSAGFVFFYPKLCGEPCMCGEEEDFLQVSGTNGPMLLSNRTLLSIGA